VVSENRPKPETPAPGDWKTYFKGNSRKARVFSQRGPGLFKSISGFRNPVTGRKPTDPIGLSNWVRSQDTGVLYVLDESSIGLHQRDNDRLLQTLKRLRDLIRLSWWSMKKMRFGLPIMWWTWDGGKVVAQGTPKQVMQNSDSLTGAYLTGRQEIPVPKGRREGMKGGSLVITGARINNLKNLTVHFPLAKLVCVTGVSGGGKSSLVVETLYKGLAQLLNGASEEAGPYETLEGAEFVDKIIDIDQSPIGRTPRSNPATYIGMFTPIREWFAGLPEAKARGYAAGRFSFNVKGGRCETFQGDGVIKIEMHFLP